MNSRGRDYLRGCPSHQIIKHNNTTNNRTNWHHMPPDNAAGDTQWHLCTCQSRGEKYKGANREIQNVGHSIRKLVWTQNVSIMKKKKKSQTALDYRRPNRRPIEITQLIRSWIKKQKYLWKDIPEPVREFEYRLSAAAAKSLQSCPTLCDPIDGSPSGSTVPGILQARTLEWVY